MKIEYNYSKKEKLILEAALKVMLKEEFAAVNIEQIADEIMLDPAKIKISYKNNDELRMSAMEYAARSWMSFVRNDILNEADKHKKLYKLICHYALGTENYPESLSLYIDIWKRIRDGNFENLEKMKEKLSNIYDYYEYCFVDIISKEICTVIGKADELKHLSQILVAISDGLHIQSLFRTTAIDFEGIGNTLYKITEQAIFRKEENQ
ncbi:MAG: hypothetical protein ACOZCL_02080 [Bacillota bacterium]